MTATRSAAALLALALALPTACGGASTAPPQPTIANTTPPAPTPRACDDLAWLAKVHDLRIVETSDGHFGESVMVIWLHRYSGADTFRGTLVGSHRAYPGKPAVTDSVELAMSLRDVASFLATMRAALATPEPARLRSPVTAVDSSTTTRIAIDAYHQPDFNPRGTPPARRGGWFTDEANAQPHRWQQRDCADAPTHAANEQATKRYADFVQRLGAPAMMQALARRAPGP